MPVTIVSLGKATQDVFLRSARDFVPRPGPGGRVLVLPLGAKLDLDDLVVTTGGNAANAATTFAWQGLRSRFLWALGEDEASTRILEALRDDGVDVTHVLVEPGRTASVSVVLLAPSGERTILNERGTLPSAFGARLDLEPIAGADWLYLSSLAGDMRLLGDALAVANAFGTRVLLNPAGTELALLRALLPMLPRCDVVAVNADEARLLLGCVEQDPDELAVALSRTGPAALVTDGARGASFCDGSRLYAAGISAAREVVDTTGCGDAFASGFLARLALGEPVSSCIAFGAANAASVLRHVGSRAGILRPGAASPSLPVVERPVEQRRPPIRPSRDRTTKVPGRAAAATAR
ncbi:carbohydrate kinase family protein [Amnibacterium kyonggiense]|uniref:Ribokinase n=1 Tax=Amnibacterium kyonggiense TaxID=595671 RepID=A0A4R7FKD7_9MICO|nr:carbohydrate kinase family protein [Amnibacterium kyonggiense]TDS76831.1 ribokinase [Amnibacterium kyonggiense]